MIEALILGASFLILLFIGVIVIVVRYQQTNMRMFENLTGRIDETQKMFKEQVTKLLGNFQDVLNQIDKK